MNDWGRDEDEAAEALAWLADRALGTAVDVLDARGDVETAGLLAFSDLTYRCRDRDFGIYYCAVLTVEPALLDFFNDERCRIVLDTLQAVHRGQDDIEITELVAAPRMVEGDWRTERRIRHSSPPDRQPSSTLAPASPSLPPPKDGAEVIVFNAFRQVRADLPAHDTLVLGMNTRLQLPNGSIAEVDDLVFRKGRVGVVEIDGGTHRRGNRYAADASRDQLLRDAGIHVERVCAEDVSNPREVEALVKKVLTRLAAGT